MSIKGCSILWNNHTAYEIYLLKKVYIYTIFTITFCDYIDPIIKARLQIIMTMKIDYGKFCCIIRKARKQNSFSQIKISNKLCITQKTYSKLENDHGV
jgi:hypothetical protein